MFNKSVPDVTSINSTASNKVAAYWEYEELSNM